MADWKDRLASMPGLGGTLSTLVRTAMHQVDNLRDAAIREAGAGKHKFDIVRLKRRRRDVAAALGNRVYELSMEGLGSVTTDHETADLLHELEQLDTEIEAAELESQTTDWHADYEETNDGTVSSSHPSEFRVWRPEIPDDADVVSIHGEDRDD